MYGMLCVLLAVAMWLLLATYLELPVSTTHSVVGGVVGMAVAAEGWGAVKWRGVAWIAASWLTSPVLAGAAAAAGFATLRASVLRSPDSLRRSHWVRVDWCGCGVVVLKLALLPASFGTEMIVYSREPAATPPSTTFADAGAAAAGVCHVLHHHCVCAVRGWQGLAPPGRLARVDRGGSSGRHRIRRSAGCAAAGAP